MSGPARLIALDWGTSSLRAYLLADAGTVLAEEARPWGIMSTPGGDFAAALATLTEDWRRRDPDLPVIAAGMIGSAQGWQEIPYVPCPTGPDELVAAMRHHAARQGAVPLIVPGVVFDGEIPDVMRGEETQIIGVLATMPRLAAASTLVLPGTHSKWVRIRDGRIVSFCTYMTGELFAVLRGHSILGRPAQDAPPASRDREGASAAFEWGVRTIVENPRRGLSSLLFSVRTQVVSSGRLTPADSLDYLSGLLLGDELRNAFSTGDGVDADRLALVGDPALCARYHRAFELFGIDKVPTVTGSAPVGLWHLAEATILDRPTSHIQPRVAS